MPNCDTIFDHFEQLTRDDLMKIISVMNKTTCVSDPFPTKLLMSHLPAIVDIILGIVNLCFESAVFPLSCKSSVIIPLIKKPGLDSEVLKNYRPISLFYLKLLKRRLPFKFINIFQRLALLMIFSLLIKLATVVKQHF